MVGFEEHVTGSHGIQVKADHIFDGDLSDYDLVVLPGGWDQLTYEIIKPLISEIQAFNRAGKKIAAICALNHPPSSRCAERQALYLL